MTDIPGMFATCLSEQEGRMSDLQTRQSEFLQETSAEIIPSYQGHELQDDEGYIDPTYQEQHSANSMGDVGQDIISSNNHDIMMATIKAWRNETTYATKSVKTVTDVISLKDCVCVIGVPGAGKSTALHHAALSLEKDDFIIYSISGPEEFLKYYDISKKQVFVQDDALGVHSVSQSKVDSWKEHNEKVRKCLGKNTKLLVSMRTQIYMYMHELVKDNQIIFLDKLLTTVDFSDPDLRIGVDEMRNMLTHYMTVQGCEIDNIKKVIKKVWPKNEEEFTEMTDNCRERGMSRYTIGLDFAECFPLLCMVFVNTDYVKNDPATFFKNPFPALTRIFQNIKQNNRHQFCALVLCTIFDGTFDKNLLLSSYEESLHNNAKHQLKIRNFIMSTYKLQCPDELEDLQIAFNSLTGVYISHIGDSYRISHALFHDIVTYLYDDPIFVFKYGTSEFIQDRVRINTSPLHDPYVIIYSDDKNIERLADRLISDSMSYTRRGFELIIDNPNIDDDRLISCLRSTLLNRDKVEKKFVDELFLHCMKTVLTRRHTYKNGEVTHYKLIEVCVHAGVDCNMFIIESRYPIHISILTGSLQLTRLLLRNGADKRRVVKKHNSVLHWVCRYVTYNKLELLELLIQHEGDRSVVGVTSNRRRILQELGRDSNNVHLQEVLSDNSFKVLTTDVQKMYQYVARYRGKLQLVRRIHDNLLTYTDDWDRNILHYTVNDFNVTKYLLGYPQLQKEINHRDRYGRTAFWYVMNDKVPNKKKVVEFSSEDKEVMIQLYKDNYAIL